MLSFRKTLSSKADKVAELVQDVCTEALVKNLVDILSSSAQDLAASKVVVESNAENAECDMFQGDKVGNSTFEEWTRRKDSVIASELLEGT